jgi:hypothetical protein
MTSSLFERASYRNYFLMEHLWCNQFLTGYLWSITFRRSIYYAITLRWGIYDVMPFSLGVNDKSFFNGASIINYSLILQLWCHHSMFWYLCVIVFHVTFGAREILQHLWCNHNSMWYLRYHHSLTCHLCHHYKLTILKSSLKLQSSKAIVIYWDWTL